MSIYSPLDAIHTMALATPSRTAIRHGGRSCDYAQLWSSSDHVAAQLRDRGVTPGETVGIALDRSIEWMTAMLGILKSGAAYLPLDPAYPVARLMACIEDSGVRHMISDAANRHISPDKALCIDALTGPDHTGSSASPALATQPAYMLYTSGSSGRPKGVVVPMSALSYQMDWLLREFRFTRDDVFLQKTSVSFDASVWEYLAPLMVGATMVIGDGAPGAMADAVRTHGVTILQVVPTVLQALCDLDSLDRLSSLRLLFCGGEPLPRKLVSQVQGQLQVPIINLYGPTEATVQCAFHVCRPGDADARDPVPLGRPIPGTAFHIDRAHAAAEPGELLIEGPGVALGYHNLPGQSAARFGVSPATGHRHYRSGDLVGRDDHGDFVFVGRVDNQVKLRGLRIELEEIEHAIATALPAVRKAMVVINDAQQVEAFIETDTATWDEGAARAAVGAAIPAFMQPSRYTVLERIPCLPNGKRDRAALKALSTRRGAKAINDVPADPPDVPRQPPGGTAMDGIASHVRTEWAALLPHSARDDSHFFRAGGHSLLAMQLIARLNRHYALQLSASALFARPTLGALTRMVRDAVRDTGNRYVSAGFQKIGGNAGNPRIWFIHPAGGALWCYRDIAQSARAVESFGIGCEPLDGACNYETDLRRMACRYADLLLVRQPEGPYLLCGYSFGGNVAYEMAVYMKSLGADVSLVLLDTYRSRATGEDTLDFIASYARKLTNGRDDAPSRAALAAMSVDERNRLLLELGTREGHLPPDATFQDLEQGLAMWIANNRAATTHEPCGQFDGPALFIRCTGNTRDSVQGWHDLLPAMRVKDVPADHFTVYRPPIAAHVAALIDLAATQPVPRGRHVAA
jgi:amino acid adenylation domain-containing protein